MGLFIRFSVPAALRFLAILAMAGGLARAVETPPVAWGELTLSIEEDRGFSSDHATLCRVRVVNNGRSSWAGRSLVFEARALRSGQVAARQRGRFGLTLGPRETLETVVGFVGRFDRFEVSPRPSKASASDDESGRRGGRSKRAKKKKGG
jgi:hypothetical protein